MRGWRPQAPHHIIKKLFISVPTLAEGPQPTRSRRLVLYNATTLWHTIGLIWVVMGCYGRKSKFADVWCDKLVGNLQSGNVPFAFRPFTIHWSSKNTLTRSQPDKLITEGKVHLQQFDSLSFLEWHTVTMTAKSAIHSFMFFAKQSLASWLIQICVCK